MKFVDPDLTGHRPSSGMDAGTKRLALFAGGIGALLVALVGGWSMLGHHPTGIPIIAPPPGPVRVRPLDPGGMQLMGAQTLSASNAGGAQALAPGPEAPQPAALQAAVDAARKADAPPPPKTTPVPPTTRAASTTPPAAITTTTLPPATSAANTQTEQSNAQPEHTVPPLATGAAGPPAAGPMVQLAAVDTEAAAHTQWSRFAHQVPALLANRAPVILRVDHAGRIFYRLRVAGFASPAEATAFCAQAKARNVACTLADF